MKIEHIALYVRDLEAMRAFLETWFSAKAGPVYHNPKTGFRSYFLRFSDGARLEIMTAPHMQDPEKTLARTGYSHIAFSLGSREAVDALTARLQQAGYTCLSGPRVTGDGYYESCILGPECCQIELTV